MIVLFCRSQTKTIVSTRPELVSGSGISWGAPVRPGSDRSIVTTNSMESSFAPLGTGSWRGGAQFPSPPYLALASIISDKYSYKKEYFACHSIGTGSSIEEYYLPCHDKNSSIEVSANSRGMLPKRCSRARHET